MRVEPGQVYLVWHNYRSDPFLILAPSYREGENYDVASKWSVLNLTNLQQLYIYDDELTRPDSEKDYYAIERLF